MRVYDIVLLQSPESFGSNQSLARISSKIRFLFSWIINRCFANNRYGLHVCWETAEIRRDINEHLLSGKRLHSSYQFQPFDFFFYRYRVGPCNSCAILLSPVETFNSPVIAFFALTNDTFVFFFFFFSFLPHLRFKLVSITKMRTNYLENLAFS